MQFVQKVTFELLMDFTQAIIEVENITKAAAFKSFLHLSYKNMQLLFLWQCFFNNLIRQTLTNDFWGLNKNMNGMFPLSPFTSIL